MQNCLAIDVAKSKSMVTLVSSSGEVLIDPYEVNHSINDFSNLLNRINNFKLDNVSVIMESTGVYIDLLKDFSWKIIIKYLLLILFMEKWKKEI